MTRWTTVPDAFGGVSFGTPEVLDGRWEDRVEMFRNPAGEEVASNSIVYLGADINVGDWLYQGESAAVNPTTLGSGATVAEIRQIHRMPDLRNMHTLRKVFL